MQCGFVEYNLLCGPHEKFTQYKLDWVDSNISFRRKLVSPLNRDRHRLVISELQIRGCPLTTQ